MAGPDRAEAKNDGQNHVRRGPEPIAFHGKVQCLEAEGRKGCVTAANAGHESEPPFRPDEQSPFGAGVGREEADDEAAAYVYKQRSIGKRFAETATDHAGEPVARDTAERAAACHQQVIEPMHCSGIPKARRNFNTPEKEKEREEQLWRRSLSRRTSGIGFRRRRRTARVCRRCGRQQKPARPAISFGTRRKPFLAKDRKALPSCCWANNQATRKTSQASRSSAQPAES